MIYIRKLFLQDLRDGKQIAFTKEPSLYFFRFDYLNKEQDRKINFNFFPEDSKIEGYDGFKIQTRLYEAGSESRIDGELKAFIRDKLEAKVNDFLVLKNSSRNNSEYTFDLIKQDNIELYKKYEEITNNENHTIFLNETKEVVHMEDYVKTANQIIFYGVPGCGKSYSIDNKLAKLGITNDDKENYVSRIVFHPEYTNADFVGQILPTLTENGTVDYKFKPGEFTKILKKAYEAPKKTFVLIIEEINRGNAAAIFGDLFQLLDRLENQETDGQYNEGWSSYCVMNDYINAYIRGVYNKPTPTSTNSNLPWFTECTGIRLPPNLTIFATMNTSDQNVFKLDNAFKRRWNLEMIPNEFDFTCDNEEQQLMQLNQCNADIEGFEELTDFTWGAFRAAVNELITNPDNGGETNSFADKQIGTWFVKAVKTEEDSYYIPLSIFKNKVLEYLWDDVFTEVFTIFNSEYKTLAQIIEALPEKADNIFTDDFYNKVEDWNKVISERQIATHEKTKEEITPLKTINEKTPYLEKLETIIQESQPNYQLNLNCKEYIGLIEKDAEKGNNFMFFKLKKRKQECEIVCKTKVDKDFEEYLTNNFGGIKQAAASKSKVYYTVTIPYPAEDVLTEKYNVIKETAKKAFELQ